MSEQRMATTVRDCPGRLVPVGDAVTIPAHNFVTITQALGGNYTVVYQGNMIRVDGTDADALGLEKYELTFDDAGNGEISSEQVWQALETVYDPEIPVNLKSLGLIYAVDIGQDSGKVNIKMTLTAPGCGMGPVLVGDVKYRVALVPNVKAVNVELVFYPPWNRDMMSEEAQLETGLFF
ncbi:putative Fe-S cluster assembly protein SufT [Marinagarivorans algicola]|uniref:putative Fe-S cluster assembly protein SufT n=1 Tax=Marinagarivorans algicola TaxID=1513270 RepID=UPI0006BA08FF|nr:putative Fe-S cluster assembly protein SufT [Marinagarivorans algicola]